MSFQSVNVSKRASVFFLLLLLFSCPQGRQLKRICPSGQQGGQFGPQLFGCEADIVHEIGRAHV